MRGCDTPHSLAYEARQVIWNALFEVALAISWPVAGDAFSAGDVAAAAEISVETYFPIFPLKARYPDELQFPQDHSAAHPIASRSCDMQHCVGNGAGRFPADAETLEHRHMR